MKPKDYAALLMRERTNAPADKTEEAPAGWVKTMHVVALLGYKTLAGVRLPIQRIVKAGFAQEMRITRNRFAYRLSPKFKSWPAAKAAAEAAGAFKAPAGWVTLSEYARKHRRTVRGIQYRIDGSGIEQRIFRNPRSVPYYRRTDLDRLVSKAP
jgi:hypothetical protein